MTTMIVRKLYVGALVLLGSPVFAQKAQTISVGGQSFKHVFVDNAQRSSANCGVQEVNRSIDGTCNNLSSTITCDYGSTEVQLERILPANYTDGVSGMIQTPNPRLISNEIHVQDQALPSLTHSSLVFTWGQFLDHDIVLTPEGAESEVIPLPANEPLFQAPIEFHRSMPDPTVAGNVSREQINIITAWIDGSQVYGSDITRANWLRTMQDGKLKTSAGNMLPYNTTTGESADPIDTNAPSMAGDRNQTVKLMVAGDVRANEQPGLLSLHTLFVREHNRMADELVGSGMTDEQIYQHVRKRVGAIMQAITYEEFLPQLGVKIGMYNGFDPSVKPNVLQIFATAAYRIGHTMVGSSVFVEDPQNGSTEIPLMQAFFNPTMVLQYGIGPILNGLALHAQETMDQRVVDELREFLFPVPGSNVLFGLDLASLNIQRGRDHGLPSYKTVRDFILNDNISDFEHINRDATVNTKLAEVYGDLENIDLWTGLVCEGGSCCSELGILENQILKRQFQSLRDGDFYFYQNDPALDASDRNVLKTTTLADVISRNTTVDLTGDDVFSILD